MGRKKVSSEPYYPDEIRRSNECRGCIALRKELREARMEAHDLHCNCNRQKYRRHEEGAGCSCTGIADRAKQYPLRTALKVAEEKLSHYEYCITDLVCVIPAQGEARERIDKLINKIVKITSEALKLKEIK